MRELTDRVALVTGGGGGLGEAIARRLACAGARVAVADVRAECAQEVAADIERQGGRAVGLPLDVSEAAQVAIAVERTVANFGSLDVLVNNAGVDRTVSVEELEVADWQRIVAVNLTGPFLMAKQVFPLMRERGDGHIVNICSTAAKRAWANAAAYHASKWGLLGFSHALHVEGRKHGIKVTALIAGGMRTPFLLDRFPDIDIDTLQPPENVADTVRYVLTQPEGTVIPEVMVLPMRETSWP